MASKASNKMSGTISQALKFSRLVLNTPLFSKFRKCSVMMRSGLGKGLKRQFGLGFRPRFTPTMEEQFLRSLDFNGMTVYDVGGYVGIYTLFFARAVGREGRVITFEPNPLNYQELCYNVALNGFNNVSIIPVGLGEEKKKKELVFDPIFPARSTIKKESLLKLKRTKTVDIQIDSLDNQYKTKKLPPPDFIKIDVEGYELEAIGGMTNILRLHRPYLFIELHGNFMFCVIKNLKEFGYDIYHIEHQTDIMTNRFFEFNDGHIFCTAKPEHKNTSI